MYRIDESVTFKVIKEAETKIQGLALQAQVSRNGIFYSPSVLKSNDNKTVPLFLNHQTEKKQIGQATFTYNEDDLALYYKAVVTDPELSELVKENTWQVSIGGNASGEVKTECDKQEKNCYESPEMVAITELSLLDPSTPAGIKSASVEVVETKRHHECVKCKHNTTQCDCSNDNCEQCNTSLKEESAPNSNNMTDKIQSDKVDAPVEDVKEDTIVTKTVTKEEPVATPVEAPAQQSEQPSYVSKEDFEAAIGKIGELIAGISKVPATPQEDKVIPAPEPQVKVAPEVTQEDVKESSEVLQEALQQNGIYTIEVDVEDYLAKQMRYNESSRVTEAFTGVAGDGNGNANGQFRDPNSSNRIDGDVMIRPSNESFTPVRQWLNVKTLGKGVTKAVWYYMNSELGADAAATATSLTKRNAAGLTTDVPEVAKAFSSIDIEVGQQIGYKTTINTTDMEDSKFDLVGAFREISARRKLQWELTETLATLRALNHGGIQSGLTKGDAPDGVTEVQIFRTISGTTVAKTLTVEDILNIVEYYKDSGYEGWSNTSGIKPVLVCSIDTWKQIYATAIADNQYQRFFVGKSGALDGKVVFEDVFGITIVPVSAINTAPVAGAGVTRANLENSAAFSFLPKYSLCMATKRELTIKFQEETTQLKTNVTTSWRSAFSAIDPASIIRYELGSVAAVLAANA